ILVLNGDALKDFPRYNGAVHAAGPGCESKEKRTALGPKLYRYLLGADNSISVLIEQTDPRDYAAVDGANVLLKFLETERFAKSSFHELPKAFDAFFDLAHFERKGEEPMAAFSTAMEVARRNLGEAGPGANISSSELGYHALKLCVLDTDLRNLAFARADETFNFGKISTTLKNLFPRGGFFNGRIDGEVGESAAASGQAAGENPGIFKGKGKGGGKLKDKRCSRCGRMDRDASVSGQAGKPINGKRRGKGARCEARARTTSTCCSRGYDIMVGNLDSDPIVPDMPELDLMISSDLVPASLVDSGASIAVAGRGWLDRVEAELAKSNFFEILGDMVGLTSRKDFAELGANLYMRENGHWADFQGLGVHGKELVKLPGGRAGLDLFDYDRESHESEPFFERFRVGEMQLELGASAPARVAELLKNGSKGIFNKGTLERTDKLMKGHPVIFDVLRDNLKTFPWEMLAKGAHFSRVASKGGHANATPSDASVGVNFNGPRTQSDFEFLIKTFEPQMVSVAFPRAPFSNLREFQRAQGMGDRVGDLIDEFRPLVDFSAKVFRIQAEGALLSRASAWPDILEKTLASAGAHGLARRTDLEKLGIGDDATRVLDKRTMRAVAEESKLGKDLIDVRVLRQNEAIPVPRGAARRICAMCTDEGVPADFSDAYADDPNVTSVELAARYPTDTVVAIYVKEPKLQTAFPATVPLLGSRPEALKPDDRESDAVHRDLHREGESFGVEPPHITTGQWGALRKPHLNLSHPSAHALTRRLKSYGVPQKVLDVVDKMDRVVCEELGGPSTTRSANLKLSTEFNENVFLDEADVIRSGTARLMAMVIVDDASSFRVIIPTAAVRSMMVRGAFAASRKDGYHGLALRRQSGTGHRFLRKDHFKRLNRDMQLAKSDDPSAWTSVIASTRNNRIRRNGFTPYQYVLGRSPHAPASLIEAMEGDRRQLAAKGAAFFEDGPRRAEQIRCGEWAVFELDSDGAVRRATVGRYRPPRGPCGPGQLAFYLREVRHVNWNRLQGEHGRRGPAIVLAAEGHARRYTSATVGCRFSRLLSRCDMLLAVKPRPTLQKGFVDERGPGPDVSGGQRDRRRKKDDGDADAEDAVGDAPANKTRTHPKYHHYLEMETTSRTLEMRRDPEMKMTCKMSRLTNHLCLMQLGGGVPRTWARPLCRAIRSNSLGEKDSQHLHRRLVLEGPCASDHCQTTSKQIADASACAAKLSSTVKNCSRDAFAARRTDAAKKQIAPKSCRQLRSTPPEWRTAFDASDLEEWRKRVQCDAVEWPSEREFEQHPLKAKSRNIAPGYKDMQLFAGEWETNAPTLADAATAVIIQEAACQSGWRRARGARDGMAIRPRRDCPEGEWGIYGSNDAPLLWYEEHRDAILSLPGASRSELRPALFIFRDERGELIGLIGAQVDDDLVAGSPEFISNQLAEQREVLLRQVQNLLDFNKLVSDAKTDRVDITFQKLDNAIVVAVGGSSHGNVGKTRTVGYPDVEAIISHQASCAAYMAAKTLAAVEAVESGDLLRQHLVELHHGLGYRTHMDDVKAIEVVEVAECKSLYDLPQKRAAVPSEKRLLIDIESLRNDTESTNVASKWVNAIQMLADCLTMQGARAGDCMRRVLRTDESTKCPMAKQVISEQRMELKGQRGEYNAPKHYLRWRMMLGQREGDVYCEKLKDMVDWSGLGIVAKRRGIPTHARKLLTIYAPNKEALERYEKDFTEKHNLKKTDTTDDIEHYEDVNITSGENQNADEPVDLDDVKEINMADAAGAETEEIGGGAAGASAALVACAACRMVADQCECQPRTRKKANHNIPVPNDGDESVEIPGQAEQSGGLTTRKKTTELPMDKARRQHERSKYASYRQAEHDLGDVLDQDVLEAYLQVVAGCSKCRRASRDTEDIPKGKGTGKGKGKLRTSSRVDPDECVHPADQLSIVGANQYKVPRVGDASPHAGDAILELEWGRTARRGPLWGGPNGSGWIACPRTEVEIVGVALFR
ncbi:unnamed protein product, partial [Prorocentrum cordatum]